MAARKQLWHPDHVKERIKISQLLNRLHQCAFGEVELSSVQLEAIKTLLRKAVPDLANVQHSSDPAAPVKLVIEWQSPAS